MKCKCYEMHICFIVSSNDHLTAICVFKASSIMVKYFTRLFRFETFHLNRTFFLMKSSCLMYNM